jgi:hypothetical protein
VPEWPDNLSQYIGIGWLKRAYSSEGMDGPWQYICAVREAYRVDKSDVSALFDPHNTGRAASSGK